VTHVVVSRGGARPQVEGSGWTGVRLGAAGQGRNSPVGGKPISEGLASHRVARPWEVK
jgi:hypothetical protein